MKNTRTPSKYTVDILNLKGFEKDVIKFLQETGKWCEGTTVHAGYTYGLVEKNGKHYLIDSEGVGSIHAVEDDKAYIGWYKQVDEGNGVTSIGVMPCAEMDLTLDELLKTAKITKHVRLDKFIRVFGDRLDRNYYEWERFLDKLVEE